VISIHFTASIVGGPHDGDRFVFNGSSDDDQIFEKMDKIHFDGHNYKIIEFDKATMHAVVMW